MLSLSALVVVLFLLLPLLNYVQAAHILGLFVNGIRSHLLVYSAVVRVLLERGHQFTLVTTLPLEDESLVGYKTKLRHIKLSSSYTNESKVATSDPFEQLQQMLFYIGNSGNFLRDSVWQNFINEKQSFDLLLLGYHFNDYQLGVAAHFNCPVVLIWTGQPISNVHSLLGNPEFRWHVPQAYDRHERRGLSTWTLGVWEKSIELIVRSVMRSMYNTHFPASLYPDFDAVRQNVSLALCNHHSLSEGPIAPYVPAIIEIGGIQISTVTSLRNYTVERDIIFISLGTRTNWSDIPTAVVQSILTVFLKLNSYDIFWTSEEQYCGEIRAVASHIHCSAWWPQSQILADKRTKLFITHGGKASLAEALHHGVPILGLPLVGDQFANVAKAVRQGFGLTLKMNAVTSDKLHSVVHELLHNNSYAQQADRLSRIYHDRPLNASATVAYWVEYVLRYNGAPHLQSPAVYLHFWQYYNLDVHAFILCICICICACLKWLEQQVG